MENPYLTPGRVRAALRSLDLRPTRGMGQNFLVDPSALDTIVAAAELNRADTVVEVGPGLGVLTWELLQRAGRVVAVELDRRLAARLHEEFAGAQNLEIVQGDILNLAPEQLLADHRPPITEDGRLKIEDSDANADGTLSSILDPRSSNDPPYKVVANLPYAITSAVLRHFLEAERKPKIMVVLVQWEVALRITARPGDLSVLAHSVQIYAEPEIVARVPAGSFLPAPAVDSAVLLLQLRPRPAVEVDDIDKLMRVIKAGFLQARKKLSNALPSGLAAMGMRIDKQRAIAVLEATGVDPGRRAETLTLEEWAGVYRHLALRRGE
ncbi:MAG TPA: 16S rRNA (adenine(1518)-N(6)/adenine(1519)-N(6))-dimethyltransferase RsmA [Roseiflexaceae bacterium]|nr:16S rRNA (adenine(1518)-N(6)/adenine(1519)-N(6))-dimethyltransferase RsmA [Roseiflexaceae bacterium]